MKRNNPVMMKRILQTTNIKSDQNEKIENILSIEDMLQIRGGAKSGNDPEPPY